MSSNLAIKLRAGTQKAHTAAENAGFTKCFLKGVIDRGCFAKFLGNLYFVYSTLEAALQQHREHPFIKPLYFPELNRTANLEKDLEFYYGKDWKKQISLLPAAQTYIKRIREIAASDPVLLLAHSYTRYMGDLSGGQMFQKIAQNALKLEGYQGTSFYQFEQIPDKNGFKDKYRQALNALPLDDATADRVVAEANYAFHLNNLAAQDMEGSLIQAIGQVMYNSLIRSHNQGSTEEVKSAKC